jgi:hypothetical protein
MSFKAGLDIVLMFTFNRVILLMSVRTRDKMINTNMLKERTQLVVLTPPNLFAWVGSSDQRGVSLKIMELLKNLGLMFEKINPSELTKIINKRYVIVVFSNRSRGRAPNIRKDQF